MLYLIERASRCRYSPDILTMVTLHRYCSIYLQVVRELSSSSITRVHGDENRAGWVQRQLCPLKQEGLEIPSNGPLDAKDLLGHDRQHLYL